MKSPLKKLFDVKLCIISKFYLWVCMREKTITFDQLTSTELIQEILAGNEQAVLYLLLDKCGSRLKFLCEYKFKALEIEFPELIYDTYEILRRNDWKALKNFRGENQQGQK